MQNTVVSVRFEILKNALRLKALQVWNLSLFFYILRLCHMTNALL